MGSLPEQLFEFGSFRLDPVRRVLWLNSEPLDLPPKAIETLVVLVQHHGQLVEKDELMKAVWPDSFVGDANIAVHISNLRKLFEERGNGERFIETVPRRGYRFVAPVVERGEACESPSSVAAVRPGVVASRAWLAWTGFISGALVIVAIIALVAIRHRPSRTVLPRQIHSVAVLPLRNLSGDPSQDYLADGLTEALITDLAQIRAMRVISRTSVMAYKNPQKKLPEIARELNVDGVVEGSVIRAGDRVQITAQLVDATTDTHLWAKTFEGTMRDLLGLQAQAAQTIAQAVRVTLTPDEKLRLAAVHLMNPEAHELYLQGRYLWNQRAPAAMLKSLVFYENATKIDPRAAEAYAAMASVYITQLGSDQLFSLRQLEAKARAAANKALSIDEALAEPHAALALVKAAEEYGWKGSDAEFQRAFELDPNYATAHHWYAFMLLARGRYLQAYEEVQKAMQLDPLNQAEIGALAAALFGLKKHDLAMARTRKFLELEPTSYFGHWALADLFAASKKYDDAIAAYQETLRITPHNPGIVARLGYVLAMAGRSREARQQLQEIELAPKSAYSSGGLRAFVHIGLGERNRAIELLQKDYEQRSIGALMLVFDFHFDLLRSDPRFEALVRKIGLDQ
jgi:TolB-like protein/DNA-binding winged helix-turn-helix (wHTH) protein/Tfp pilus assembly protein PilF